MIRINFTILSLLFLLILTQEGKAQWKQVEIPAAYRNTTYLDIYFNEQNPKFGWMCGFNGYVMRTVDSGRTWQGTIIPGGGQLESIDFPTPEVGYCSGMSGMWKSIDSGKTWRRLNPGNNLYRPWGNFFLDENNGIVLGGGCDVDNAFMRTTDGGDTWNVFIDNTLNTGLADAILGNNTGTGYAVSSGLLWRTDDGGFTWLKVTSTGEVDWQEEIAWYDNTFLIPYSPGCEGHGDGGGVRISTDGGGSFSQYETGESMFGAFLLDENRGFACGENNTIIYTSDGGKTWEDINCGVEGHTDDIWFIDDTTGFVVGDNIYEYTGSLQNPRPKILYNGPLKICGDEDVVLRCLQEYEGYLWSTGETTREIVVDETGEYWVMPMNDPCAEGVSDTVFIEFFDEPEWELEVLPANTLCEGDTAFVEVNGDFIDYNWSDGAEGKQRQFYESGDYTVTVTDTNGCEYFREISITINPRPDPEIWMLGDSVLCPGETNFLETQPGMASYEWYAEGTSNVAGRGSKLEIESPGNYYVRVVNEFGCDARSDIYSARYRVDSNQLNLIFSTPAEEEFIDTVYYPEMSCRDVRITNTSSTIAIIDHAFTIKNTAFSVPPGQLPLAILPGDTANLRVCYIPSEFGIERDTAVIFDNCADHRIPLWALSLKDTYRGETRCDVDIRLRPEKLPENYVVHPWPPYPNPAGKIVYLDYERIIPRGEDFSENCSLYNTLGQKIMTGEPKIESVREYENAKVEYGKYIFDLHGLPQGVYIIVMESKYKTYTFTVLVER